MPYLIRLTKDASGRVRDGNGTMRDCSMTRYTVFEKLPQGNTEDHHPGYEVHFADSQKKASKMLEDLDRLLVKTRADVEDRAKRTAEKVARVMKAQNLDAKPKPKEPEPKAKSGKLSAADTVGRG
jgi:hypothetical protein